MPHDQNGHPIIVGDVVFVACKVIEVHESEDYCNLSLQTLEPMFPADNKSILTLNARQVWYDGHPIDREAAVSATSSGTLS